MLFSFHYKKPFLRFGAPKFLLMKNIFFLFLLMSAFTAGAQNVIAHYNFSIPSSTVALDVSDNGYDASLYGGAYISHYHLYAGKTDSDYMSVPPETINGLGDF